MYTVEINEGRLIEARIRALKTEEQAKAYATACSDLVKRTTSKRSLVLCADHRPVVVYAPAVADTLAHLFGLMNGRLERIAVLVARTNATLSLQLERIVREAANPSRRVFYDVRAAEEFLADSLDPRERARLRIFLAS